MEFLKNPVETLRLSDPAVTQAFGFGKATAWTYEDQNWKPVENSEGYCVLYLRSTEPCLKVGVATSKALLWSVALTPTPEIQIQDNRVVMMQRGKSLVLSSIQLDSATNCLKLQKAMQECIERKPTAAPGNGQAAAPAAPASARSAASEQSSKSRAPPPIATPGSTPVTAAPAKAAAAPPPRGNGAPVPPPIVLAGLPARAAVPAPIATPGSLRSGNGSSTVAAGFPSQPASNGGADAGLSFTPKGSATGLNASGKQHASPLAVPPPIATPGSLPARPAHPPGIPTPMSCGSFSGAALERQGSASRAPPPIPTPGSATAFPPSPSVFNHTPGRAAARGAAPGVWRPAQSESASPSRGGSAGPQKAGGASIAEVMGNISVSPPIHGPGGWRPGPDINELRLAVMKAYLAGLTVVELKALAAELGVVVAGIQRKRELQARILAEKDGEEARAEDADDGDSDEDEDDSDEAEGEAPARAALPANRKPVWRTPPPPTASEAASSFNWLRDPWLFYDTAHREWGPETFRARAAKREAEERFARIRKLTPKIEDALVQEVIDDEIRALIKRKLDQRAVQAVEKKARWADYPSDIRELVEDVDKEVDRQRKETKKTQASRGSGKGAPPAGGQASGPRDDRRTRRGRPLKEIAHIPGAKVQRALLDIIDAAYADSTWQNIAYTHAKWRRYVRKVDLLGATVADQVLSWIGWMQADGLKASSILTEMGNVTAALKLQGVTLEDPRLRMVLKGLAKMKVEQPRDQARPISKRLMWDVVQRAPPKAAAVFAIAWLTCSRIGDVRRTPASDVTLKGELMELSWRQRKDWRNIGVVTTVRTGPWREFVERHLRLLAPTDTLGGDWTTARFASLLPKTYSGHSIRRGAAQFALKHASAESVRTLTLHATLTGLIRYAPLAHRRQQIRASRALADAGTGDEEREP
ncbi:hypothetical protein DIPPA_31375 [Diplonema papillatum]|nr:hypothetical protein DIPPA_31375 [Diplonema papillatum]